MIDSKQNRGRVEKAKFDWYSATFFELIPGIVGDMPYQIREIIEVEFLARFGVGGIWLDNHKGMNGYINSWSFRPFDMDTGEIEMGEAICTLCFGHVSASPSVFASGNTAGMLADILRMEGFPVKHHVSRCDIAFDTREIKFDDLYEYLKTFAKRKGLSTSYYGDFDRKKGRTYYVGSSKSACYLRVYEKGFEQRSKGWKDAPLDWVRIEFQMRPDKAIRERVSSMLPEEVVNISRWATELMGLFGVGGEHMPHRVESDDSIEARFASLIRSRKSSFWLEVQEMCHGDLLNLGQHVIRALINTGKLSADEVKGAR